MSNTKRNSTFTGRLIAIFLSVALLVLAGWLFFNRQYVIDLATVWTFKPSSQVMTLNQQIEFTDKGNFYFYATKPEVAASATFNQDCPRQEPSSPILGCYVSGRIYVYDITNQKLTGIEEVTAAHEMLHAAWERMSQAERDRLTPLLEAAYKTNTTDELKQRIAYYERSQPGEVINELHSILATEVGPIGDELNTYYRQYFKNRQKIIGFHQQYSAVFQSLVKQADTLYAQLERDAKDIDANSRAYDQDVAQLSADIQTFNQRAANGDFGSMAAFNAERSQLVTRSNELENRRARLSQAVASYNQRYKEYKKIGTELEALNKSIDSIAGPQEAPAL